MTRIRQIRTPKVTLLPSRGTTHLNPQQDQPYEHSESSIEEDYHLEPEELNFHSPEEPVSPVNTENDLMASPFPQTIRE